MIKFLTLSVMVSSLISPISLLNNSQEIKENARAICVEYVDYITGKKFSVCGVHAYDYFYTSPNYYLGGLSQRFLQTRKDDYSYPSSIFSVDKNYYDVTLPNRSSNVIGVYTQLAPDPSHVSSIYQETSSIVIEESYSLTYTHTSTASFTASFQTKIKTLLTGSSFSVGGSATIIQENSFSESKKMTFTSTFEKGDVIGLHKWRIEDFSYYVPIRIRKFASCANGGCHGKNGSYVSEIFYEFIPIGVRSRVRCYYKTVNNIDCFYYFEDGSQPVLYETIQTISGFPHVRVSDVDQLTVIPKSSFTF